MGLQSGFNKSYVQNQAEMCTRRYQPTNVGTTFVVIGQVVEPGQHLNGVGFKISPSF